jgi:hypothetical protein
MKTGILPIASLLLLSAFGCCGILQPTKDGMKARLDPIIGHPVKEAIFVLKFNGFEIMAGDPPSPPWNVIGTYRSTDCGLGMHFMGVYVDADKNGKITGYDIWER